jgi:hypothetical protein
MPSRAILLLIMIVRGGNGPDNPCSLLGGASGDLVPFCYPTPPSPLGHWLNGVTPNAAGQHGRLLLPLPLPSLTLTFPFPFPSLPPLLLLLVPGLAQSNRTLPLL